MAGENTRPSKCLLEETAHRLLGHFDHCLITNQTIFPQSGVAQTGWLSALRSDRPSFTGDISCIRMYTFLILMDISPSSALHALVLVPLQTVSETGIRRKLSLHISFHLVEWGFPNDFFDIFPLPMFFFFSSKPSWKRQDLLQTD